MLTCRCCCRCRRQRQGLDNSALEVELPQLATQQRVDAINKLLQRGKILLFQQGAKIIYKEPRSEDVQRFKGLSAEEMLVYQVRLRVYDLRAAVSGCQTGKKAGSEGQRGVGRAVSRTDWAALS